MPRDLQDRRVEITGPAERKMVINALNSGASGFMADFEDSLSPTWSNVVGGQQNLTDAIAGTIAFSGPDGREYELGDETATLLVRPRGWHLPEKHVRVADEPVAGAFVDAGLYLHRNARALLDAGSGPYLYLPKMERHLEARLWDEVFTHCEAELGLDHGTIKATVLIETLPGRLRDGGDPVRAARPRRRPERRALGLHLLDYQDVPRAAGVRAPRPRRT